MPVLFIRVSQILKNMVEDEAKRKGISVSAWTRLLIANHLALLPPHKERKQT